MTSHANVVATTLLQLTAAFSPWFADYISSIVDVVSVFCVHKLACWPDLEQLKLLQDTFLQKQKNKRVSWKVTICCSCYAV